MEQILFLKPCPLCHAPAEFHYEHHSFGWRILCTRVCSGAMYAGVWDPSMDAAAALWCGMELAEYQEMCRDFYVDALIAQAEERSGL